MLRASLCDCNDAYVLLSGTLTIIGAEDTDAARRLDERNKGVIFKDCAPFTDCISEINKALIDNGKYIDVVMPMYTLMEYSDNYLKRSGGLWQYNRDDPNDTIAESESSKYMIKITGKTPDDKNTKHVKIAVPLKCLSNFWRTLEIPLINCQINLFLTWSDDCVVSSKTGETQFKITDTKLSVTDITLSIEDNAKLLQQLKSGFKRAIN